MVLRFLTLASIAGVFSVLGSDAAAGEGRRCATPVPTSEQLDESRRVSAVAGERKLPFPKEGVEIPVAFHVILKYDTSGGVLGDLLDKDINKQLRVLNDAYIGTGFRFSLRSVDRTRNNAWFKSCTTQEESTMKDALAIDPARVLNVYTCDPENDDLGLSTFPQGFPESNAMHGVVISFRTLPNGAEDRYNLGITLVHETGHYLGLYHTFESGNYKNGCQGDGDGVDDTPYEKEASFGCQVRKDSCMGNTGKFIDRDPVTNYMDYSDDACMNEFTMGQIRLAQQSVAKWRPSLLQP